jgi:hypothetical protein
MEVLSRLPKTLLVGESDSDFNPKGASAPFFHAPQQGDRLAFKLKT